MRTSLLPLLIAFSLLSCMRSPYTPPVPVENDTSIRFPSFFERDAVEVGANGTLYELDGVMLRALVIAANDFLPPGGKNRPCEYRQEAQRYRILRQEGIIFIYVLPDHHYCGDPMPLDGGVKYAISTTGRILRRILDGQPEEPLGPMDRDAGGWVPAMPGVPSGYDELLKPSSSSHLEPRNGGSSASFPAPPHSPASTTERVLN
jgi:hypothetical protein